jgi:hypothetical protein
VSLGGRFRDGPQSTGAVDAAAKLAGVGKSFKLVETYTAPENVTTFDFATPLNSAVDGGYKVVFEIENAGADATYSLRINGATWVAVVEWFSVSSTTFSGWRTGSTLINLDNNSGSNKGNFGSVILEMPLCDSAFPHRFVHGQASHAGVADVDTELYGFIGRITTPATATVINSMGLMCTIASGIKAGSRGLLYRMM